MKDHAAIRAAKMAIGMCTHPSCKLDAAKPHECCARHVEMHRRCSRDAWRRGHWPQIVAKNIAAPARAAIYGRKSKWWPQIKAMRKEAA